MERNLDVGSNADDSGSDSQQSGNDRTLRVEMLREAYLANKLEVNSRQLAEKLLKFELLVEETLPK